MAYCNGRVHAAEHYAAAWAAKEAALRSLGLNWHRAIPWTDIEVRYEVVGPPGLEVAGVVRQAAAALRVTAWHVTLAHCRTHATATVLATRG